MLNILTELKRRKVYQVAAVYAAAAWGLLQVADVVFPRLGLPDWSVTFLFALEVLGFPLALILSWIFDFTPSGVVRTDAPASQRETAGSGESLAVLPFSNMSDDKALDHLADGLVEDLITRLHGKLGVPVNSRNSTFRYKGEAVDVVKVAHELGAAYVVEGSVRVQGETARVTAQLINASNDHHIWAEKFDRPLGDIFALQDELVDSIAAALMEHVPAGEAEEAGETVADEKPASLNKRWMALAVVLLLGLSGVLTWTLEQRSDERRAREVVVPQIGELIEADEHIAAYARINEILGVLPSDPVLLQYRDAVSALATIRTEPAGVRVSYKPYGSGDADWKTLGVTPLEEIRLPLGHLHLKFEGAEIVTTERLVLNPSFILDNFNFLPSTEIGDRVPFFHLAGKGEGREGMVFVEPWLGPVPIPLVSASTVASVPGFHIDKYEVSNARFQEFVDAGGYSDSRFWEGLDFGGANWSEAVAAFTDQTGQPGPAGWELGKFLHGTGDHPVTGVSWFEASAYARFRGKELPTFYHWYRAALDYMEIVDPLGPAIIKQSNFAGEGLAPVGKYLGFGFFGAYDMGGNAREWLHNADGDLRWIVGGGWNQVPYMFAQQDYASPFDRSLNNGFRCVANADGSPIPAALTLSTNERERLEFQQEKPVSDEVYAIYREQFGYLRQDLQPRLVSSHEWPHWREELIHITSPYSEEGMNLLLLLPQGSGAPLQSVILMPGSDAFLAGASMDGHDWETYEPSVAAVLHSGRAVVLPVWEGAFSRGRHLTREGDPTAEEWQERTRSRMMHWRQDLGTTLDYLKTREDIDNDRVGFLGISYGASRPIALLAVEPRIKTAVLVAGGLTMQDGHPSIKPINHASRVQIPVLMVNGRYDHTIPLVSRQLPLFEALGSDAEQKKHVVYDSGHVGFPVNQQRREIGAWLDTHLGKVR